jgi:hypothetical protein
LAKRLACLEPMPRDHIAQRLRCFVHSTSSRFAEQYAAIRIADAIGLGSARS